MRQAARLGVDGIAHAAAFVKAGVDERGLEAEVEAFYKRGGAARLPFASIIKSGPNSLWPWRILATHNDRRNRRMQNGELVIFDVGCELHGYVSDTGRTFPVSGTFTPEQRAILAMEVSVSDALIAALRPGVTLRDVQRPGPRQRFPTTRAPTCRRVCISAITWDCRRVTHRSRTRRWRQAWSSRWSPWYVQPRPRDRGFHRRCDPHHARRARQPHRAHAPVARCARSANATLTPTRDYRPAPSDGPCVSCA